MSAPTQTKSETASGRVVRVIGPVVDAEFPRDAMPDIYSALHVDVELTEGTPLVTLEFTEKERPTLVQNLAGRPVYARGRLLVEAGTGAMACKG